MHFGPSACVCASTHFTKKGAEVLNLNHMNTSVDTENSVWAWGAYMAKCTLLFSFHYCNER